ncbi:hypothetical protein H9Y04_20280 [Streptomyces sp. TRM66268-LWL]|uniref:Uncharacterized protein n=1 Tax=Streptomyces polyasparticus TaxID=2767826 RepID=A0ABR7SI07_9ACTN|nr:hypothetical protein [Streptomyces polyasparticus]MBC9714889.1 hypothetical protein [Streptomyces polyasparticus]
MTAAPRPEPHPPTGAEVRLLHDRLAALDLLCSHDLDAEYGRSGPGASGPGYRIAELARDAAPAALDALLGPVGQQWGAPVPLELRDLPGQIPESWAFLATLVAEVRIWRARDRWLALGVTRDEPARLLALVTTADPP